MDVCKNSIRLLEIPDSSNLKSIGYDSLSKELYIVFKSSAETLYVYEGVKSDLFVNLVGERSMGRMFHDLVVKASLPYPVTTIRDFETRPTIRLLTGTKFEVTEKGSV